MVGYRYSYHMNLFKDFVPNLPKMTIWSLESEELLRALCCNTHWRREIYRIIESELKDMVETLRLSNINYKLELLIGIIGFLSYNS
mmetsp:Transcript_16912/g.2777  ORF Transcript_16912/g.2777 Transcript_16912/m.2777 type:complete len:86 (+) Transcript_16912:5596-5853(+)